MSSAIEKVNDLISRISVADFPLPIKIECREITFHSEYEVIVRATATNVSRKHYTTVERVLSVKYDLPLGYMIYKLVEEAVVSELTNCFMIDGKAHIINEDT